jgi:hypothetical protein
MREGRIFRWIFRKWDGGGMDSTSGSGLGLVAGTCECGNELSDSIKCGEFLDYLRNSELLKNSATWGKYIIMLTLALITHVNRAYKLSNNCLGC